ncbi:ATP-binding protein [Spirillospora sp. NPDC052269]
MTAVDPAELRRLFLFEDLDDEKVEWLARSGHERTYAAGETICAQGEPAEFLFVLLDGQIVMTQQVQDHIVEISRTAKPGVYGGAVQAYIGDRIEQRYAHTFRALRTTRVFELPARKFSKAVRSWFPMAMHLLEGLFFGMSSARRLVDNRERLTALGTITAGLTHELNNPAAAAARAAAELGDRLVGAQKRLVELAAGGVDCEHIARLVALHDRLIGVGLSQPPRDPIAVSDAEEALGDWLDEHGVDDAWDLAPALVAAGIGVDDAERVAEIAGDRLGVAMAWLTETLEVAQLQAEISEATTRITDLLDSARQYSQLDRADYQSVDLRTLIDSTLTMLKRKVAPDVRVSTDYASDLPPVPVHAAELNQVWTNLIVNALDALGGSGTLTIRTFRENCQAVVEFADTGAGISEENIDRIFTPFFTTKPVGRGTGLGLDISWRIVVDRHGGDIQVTSVPGDTRFQVRLPLKSAAPVDDSEEEE